MTGFDFRLVNSCKNENYISNMNDLLNNINIKNTYNILNFSEQVYQ